MKKKIKIPCLHCGKIRIESRNENFCSKGCSNASRIKKNYDDIVKEKILNNINVMENGCWNWKKMKTSRGYAEISFKGKKNRANRISYRVFKGEFPLNMMICHTCDNPLCVNPDHLYVGTSLDNALDKKNRNRQAKGISIGRSKLNEENIFEIRKLIDEKKLTHDEIGKIYGVSQSCISRIVKKETWKHI